MGQAFDVKILEVGVFTERIRAMLAQIGEKGMRVSKKQVETASKAISTSRLRSCAPGGGMTVFAEAKALKGGS